MTPGARTPEELETLLEDAILLQDEEALAQLFEASAVLVAEDGTEARGGREIARIAREICDQQYSYVAGPRRVLQARDTALVLAERSINVVRRNDDGGWRYAISLLEIDDTNERKHR